MLKKGKDHNRFQVVLFCMLLPVIAVVGIGYTALTKGVGADATAVANDAEIAAALRQGLRKHSAEMTVTFSKKEEILADIPRFVDLWMEKALAETDRPDEGDYLRYQYGGYESFFNYSKYDGTYHYRVKIIPTYYTYLIEEEEAAAAAATVIDSLDLDGDSDAAKARKIYDYICDNVRYDRVHKDNDYHTRRSTAYGALVTGTATCQGYAVTLYRLLKMAGLDARVITGTAHRDGGSEYHAWNIVAIDGLYYHLDATWDAGKEEYTCFLRGESFLSDHVPAAAMTTADFRRRYPISPTDY